MKTNNIQVHEIMNINKNINCIFYDKEKENNKLWIGASGGIIVYDKNTGQQVNYNIQNSLLPTDWIFVITKDLRNNTWIGTTQGVVRITNDNIWTVYNTKNSGLSCNYVTSIVTDKKGNVWFGTYGGGLVKFDGKNWKSLTNENNSELNWIYSMAIDKNDNIWINFDYGIAKFNCENNNWTIYNSKNSKLPIDKVYSIAVDDNNIWLGIFNKLVKFDYINNVWKKHKVGDSNTIICAFSIVIDNKNNVWFGTDKGIIVYNGKKFRKIRKLGLSSKYIKTMFVSDNEIFIGTIDGVIYNCKLNY